MNNSNFKRNVPGSGKGDVLSDLQKQKEKILRDMEEQKRRKFKELEQKKIKAAPPPVILTEKVKEKTPPVKKIRAETKSFAEIMKEAENRAKHNNNVSEIPPTKKIKPNESSIPPMPIKRKLPNNIDTSQSGISNKKIKLNESKVQSEKSKPKSLMPINSLAKQNHNSITSAKINTKQNNTQNLSNYPPAKKISTNSQVLKPSQSGILAQSSSRNTSKISNHSNSKDKINNKPKSCSSMQNSSKSVNKVLQEPSSKVSSKNSSSVSNKQNENKSNCAIRNQSQNNNNNNSKSISQNKSRLNPTSSSGNNNRGIAAQNGINSINKMPQRNAHSSAAPARGIAAQNAGNVNRNYQNEKRYSSVPPARGIAAQNNNSNTARGILAQSGNRLQNGDGYKSDSDYDDEYDSELDDFIDDTEFVVDDKIKKEIYKSLNFDPKKYAKVSKYDDCTNMVSRFDDICKEEIRSSRIGREEDMLELRELEKATQKKIKMKSKY